MGLDTQAALIVAAFDLKVVQLIRKAMRTADAQGTRGDALGIVRDPVYQQRPVIHPEPRYEPRPVVHPTPHYEARPVIHPEPRVAERPPEPFEPWHPQPHKSPLPPPWRIPVWKNPIPRPREIKRVVVRPDIISKGSLLDFFI